MSSVTKLVLGFGLLIALVAVVLGFTVPVGGPNSVCSGAFAASHPIAEQAAQKYGPSSLDAVRAANCSYLAAQARPGYFVAIAMGAIIAFIGLLIGAKKPRITPIAAELAQLVTLRDQGHITSAEFETQKQRLLGQDQA